jgi:Zn-dependent protease
MLSIIIHEVSHGFVARLYGDNTAYISGRLTLNPIKHIDPIGTIVIPLLLFFSGSQFIFGWARPVPINPRNFRDYKKGMLWTAFAGPLSNLTIAAFLSMLIKTLAMPLYLKQIISGVIFVNLLLAFFNLIPIPPLDGSRILDHFLPARWSIKYNKLERYGFLIIFGLLYLGFIDYFLLLLAPIVRFFL